MATAIALLPNTAYRLGRQFMRDTLIYIQFIPPQFEPAPNFRIAHDQGSLDMSLVPAGKGLLFNAGNTAQLPFPLNWQGELWYMSDTPNATFEWEIATETSQRRDMVV